MAPQNIRVAEVSKDYVVLMWDAPVDDGGAPIVGYQIEKSLAGSMFTPAGSLMAVAGQENKYKVTKLYEGSEYLFRIMAENSIGIGEPAVTEKPVRAKLPFGKCS